jgi:hypothetical protein
VTAHQKDQAFASRIERATGRFITPADAGTLRRCERTLQRWAERECGDGSNWIIERDETTGKPFNVYHGPGKPSWYAIPDREAGALRRIAEVCGRIGLHFYHQGDCRGCMLYVAAEPLTDTNYNRGVACCG